MSNINGTTPLDFDELLDKTQNIDEVTTVAGNTNFIGVLEVNGVPIVAGSGPFLPLDGSAAMTGDLDMGANQLTNVSNIRVSSVTGDVVIGNSASTTGASGSVAIGQATTASSNGVGIGQNCVASFASVCIGQNCTSANAADVCIGFNAKSTFTTGNSVSVGNTSLCNAGRGVAVGDHTTAGGNSVALGYTVSANVSTSIAIGSNINVSAAAAIGIGASNSVTNSAVIGSNLMANLRPNNNNVCDLGTTANRFKDLNIAGSIVGPTNTRTADNIVSNAGASTSGNICTFNGTSGKVIQDGGVLATNLVTGPASAVSTRLASFNGVTGKIIQDSAINTADVFLRTGTVAMTGTLNMNNNNISNAATIDGTGTVGLGTTNATQVSIGRSGISTIVTGPLNATTPTGAWYCSTAYLPAFTAGVARLIPPTTVSAGTLVNFTHSGGVLTYTGLVARDFRISYNISLLTGPSTSNMTFFNSKNGSLVISSTQASQFFQVHPSNNATRVCVTLVDNITLAPSDTVQLAAICALTTSAVSFDFVSCGIISTLT